MISFFGSTLGFLAPLALVALPAAIAGLVYAYRKTGRTNTVTVGTLFLLRALPQKTRGRTKFVPPARFYFELLLLALLGIGASGLFLQGTGERIAVVIDNSFHLNARLPALREGRSYFETLRDDADSYANSLGAGDRVDLYVTAPHFENLGQTLSASEVKRKLLKIRSVFAGGETQSGLQRILANNLFNKVVLFSDIKLMESDRETLRNKLLIHSPRSDTESVQNIAISSADLLLGGDRRVEVELSSYAVQDIRGKIKLEGADEITKYTQTPLATLETKEVVIQKGKTIKTIFTGMPKSILVFKATFTQAAGPQVDSILEDNVAWIGSAAPTNELVLATKLTGNQLEIGRMKSVSFNVVDEEGFRKFESGDEIFRTPLILHGIAPQRLPPVSTLFVDPPLGNSLFPIKKRAAQSIVTRWLSSHPALNYLNLPDLQMKEFSVFEPTDWSRDLISTTEGVAAIVGEKEGKRYAVLGFDIFPFKGRESPTLSILTLNLIKWIGNESGQSTSLEPFASYRITSEISTVHTIDGSLLYDRDKDGSKNEVTPDSPTT